MAVHPRGPAGPEPGNRQPLKRYAYVDKNPLRYWDPSGRSLETVWEVVNPMWDVREVWRDPWNPGNWAALEVDVETPLLPGMPDLTGAASRGGKAALQIDELADLARGLDRLQEAGTAYLRAVEVLGWVRRGMPRVDILFRQFLHVEKNPGAAFQAEQALHYVEEPVGIEQEIRFPVGAGRVDLLLSGCRIIETKPYD